VTAFARQAWLVAALALATLVLWEGFRFVAEVALLVFGGVLLAILLRVPADWLERRVPYLGQGFALAIVVVLLVTVVLGVFVLFGVELASQADRIVHDVGRATERIRGSLEGSSWGRWLTKIPIGGGTLLTGSGMTLMSSVTSAIVSVAFVFFTGVYLASQPTLYRDGLLRLFPRAQAERAAEVVDELGGTLRWWLVGQLVSMTVVGVLTSLGLALLGAPFPVPLGLLAALLTFVPNVGPTIALVPAVLLAFLQGPGTALAVGALYLGVQTVESYAVTPLVQQRTVYLPPALTIASQLLLWMLAGTPGLFVATPLTAAALVLVRELWIEDTLGERNAGPRRARR
jgi:predicted PurR-regulated permease PerM